jgi:hypothetical protein
MNTYKTSATVQEHGRIVVARVPFAPGTEVEVTIRSKQRAEDEKSATYDKGLVESRDRMRELFRTIKGFRNSPRIAREEL